MSSWNGKRGKCPLCHSAVTFGVFSGLALPFDSCDDSVGSVEIQPESKTAQVVPYGEGNHRPHDCIRAMTLRNDD